MQNRLAKICKEISNLTPKQFEVIEQIINQYSQPYIFLNRNEKSDIINEDVLNDFGDTLRVHHCFSYEPFRKDKFEYALERVLKLNGFIVQMAPTGNPGHDIEINGIKVSLKTQADKGINFDKIFISKFMEMGKGLWSDNPEDLHNLLNHFFEHLNGYERIFVLRCLSKRSNGWKYELVEIPKSLLLEVKKENCRMIEKSRQLPKPGYCDVFDGNKSLKFQLYFDGGSERKLQIKNLRKKFCEVHATWFFESINI